jgi:replicative DNA helicase
MIDLNEYLSKIDIELENQILCEILTCRNIPFGLIADFFTYERKDLFVSLEKQWIKNREIDPLTVSKDHATSEILNSSGTYSEEAIDRLRNNWKHRKYGEIIYESARIENPSDRIKKIIELASQCEMIRKMPEYIQIDATSKLVQVISEINKSGRNLSGYSTGLGDIDRALNGIEKGKFYVIGALKKTGKSRFLAYLCMKLSEQGATTIFNSLEMNEVQLNSIVTSYYSGIDSSRLAYQLPQREVGALSIGFAACSEMKWEIYREYTPENLRSLIEYRKCKTQVDIVCVDFIQRMRVPHLKNDRVREVEYISQRLADMSRELNIAVIALSQLSGVAENLPPEQCPDMSHYKESQAITENADAIITMHNPERKSSPMAQEAGGVVTYSPLNLKIRIEQRYGISGYELPIVADLRTCRFSGQDNTHNIPNDARR